MFTRPETRRVDRGLIEVDGRFWTCPELNSYLENVITVRIPVYHGFNELLLLDAKGNQIGVATPDVVASGGTIKALERLVLRSGGKVCARVAAFSQGTPKIDLLVAQELPIFDGVG